MYSVAAYVHKPHSFPPVWSISGKQCSSARAKTSRGKRGVRIRWSLARSEMIISETKKGGEGENARVRETKEREVDKMIKGHALRNFKIWKKTQTAFSNDFLMVILYYLSVCTAGTELQCFYLKKIKKSKYKNMAFYKHYTTEIPVWPSTIFCC